MGILPHCIWLCAAVGCSDQGQQCNHGQLHIAHHMLHRVQRTPQAAHCIGFAVTGQQQCNHGQPLHFRCPLPTLPACLPVPTNVPTFISAHMPANIPYAHIHTHEYNHQNFHLYAHIIPAKKAHQCTNQYTHFIPTNIPSNMPMVIPAHMLIDIPIDHHDHANIGMMMMMMG